MKIGDPEIGSRELVQLDVEKSLIDPGPAFLADVHATHEGGEAFIAGLGRLVHEAEGIEPPFEILVPDFGLPWFEGGPDYRVVGIPDSPYKPSTLLVVESCCIRQCGKVFSDFLWLRLVVLKFQPLGLRRESKQGIKTTV
jgi:hypothetical protein